MDGKYDHLPPWRRPTEYTDERFGAPDLPDRPSDVVELPPHTPEFFGVDDDDEIDDGWPDEE